MELSNDGYGVRGDMQKYLSKKEQLFIRAERGSEAPLPLLFFYTNQKVKDDKKSTLTWGRFAHTWLFLGQKPSIR